MSQDQAAVSEKTHILWATNMDDLGYADIIFLVGDKPPYGVGINCGGHVIVKPLREWHRLAVGTRTPWDAYGNRHYKPVETRAAEIYATFSFNGPGAKPAWHPGGNSAMQDEARICARQELRAAGHVPTLPNIERKSHD